MKPQELEQYLHSKIPVISKLGVRVLHSSPDSIELSAPLDLNRNHLGTVFGGSLYTLSVLACYAWLFNLLQNENQTCHVVIKSGQIKYLSPAGGEFHSLCFSPKSAELENFLQTLGSKKKAKIILESEIQVASKIVCQFEGEFVALL